MGETGVALGTSEELGPVEQLARLRANLASGKDGPPADAMAEVRQAALACQACGLAALRTQVVFGDGRLNTPLVLIGQSPGEREDRGGLPFIGPAGQLLNECLAEVGIRRDQVWITNIVKCRPFEPTGYRGGRNRDPEPDEVTACAPWLEAELALIRPHVIVCIGAPSASLVLGRPVSVTRERGRWQESQRFAPARVLTVLHPAYILRHHGQQLADLRRQLSEDLEIARSMAARLRKQAAERVAEPQATRTEPSDGAPPAARQLSLFD